MTTADRLVLLKADLQMVTHVNDTYLTHLLDVSAAMIAREGIMLEDTLEDDQLIVMYAAYLYRKRASDNPVMPRMLRWSLNNRLFAQKGGSGDVT